MPSGGHSRSGPPPDPNSRTSERKGLTFVGLPNGGFTGRVPAWPLMPRTVKVWEFEDKRRYEVTDAEATTAVRQRELELWRWAWRTPQAEAWSKEPWRWHSVALWVRTAVICESNEATAADKNSLHRFADQLGLTPAGLAFNGWVIVPDETRARRTARKTAASEADAPKRERRLRSVDAQ